MRILKSLQFWVGLLLVGGAFVGVLLFAQLTTPATYEVAIAVQDIPAYTPLAEALASGAITTDRQSFSPTLLQVVLTPETLEAMAADGVFVETVRAGDVLNRGRIATGENAAKVRRLALALTDPDRVIKSIPVDADATPYVAVGDLVDLYTTLGTVRATELATATVRPLPPGVTPPPPTPEPLPDFEALARPVTVTVDLPVTKRVVGGAVVVRVNREQIPNPQYGAVTADGQQPAPFIAGGVVSVDVLVDEAAAEALDWAVFNGKMSLAVRPALWREAVDAGRPLPDTPGFAWEDFNAAFWRGREVDGTE
jgi:hypothetical protein